MNQQRSKSPCEALFLMTSNESEAVSCALDFVICADNYTIVYKDFCCKSAFDAADKIDARNFSFTKRELRSITGAIDYSLLHAGDISASNDQIERDFPGILAELTGAAKTLEALKPRLSAVYAKLSRQK